MKGAAEVAKNQCAGFYMYCDRAFAGVIQVDIGHTSIQVPIAVQCCMNIEPRLVDLNPK